MLMMWCARFAGQTEPRRFIGPRATVHRTHSLSVRILVRRRQRLTHRIHTESRYRDARATRVEHECKGFGAAQHAFCRLPLAASRPTTISGQCGRIHAPMGGARFLGRLWPAAGVGSVGCCEQSLFFPDALHGPPSGKFKNEVQGIDKSREQLPVENLGQSRNQGSLCPFPPQKARALFRMAVSA